MIVHTLSLTVTDKEVVSAARRMWEMQKPNMPPEAQGQIKNIKDVNLVFGQGDIVVTGKFVMGFMPVPFEGRCELTHENGGDTLVVRLTKVKASFFSGGGEAIVSALSNQIPKIPGLTVTGDSFRLHFPTLLAQKAFKIGSKIRSIEIRPGQLTFAIA
ncbi:MAG: hypothetical protein WCK89_04390 [bacterium]